jgi:hypothetical protein
MSVKGYSSGEFVRGCVFERDPIMLSELATQFTVAAFLSMDFWLKSGFMVGMQAQIIPRSTLTSDL